MIESGSAGGPRSVAFACTWVWRCFRATLVTRWNFIQHKMERFCAEVLEVLRSKIFQVEMVVVWCICEKEMWKNETILCGSKHREVDHKQN